MIVIKNASLRRIISRVVPYIAIPLIVLFANLFL